MPSINEDRINFNTLDSNLIITMNTVSTYMDINDIMYVEGIL